MARPRKEIDQKQFEYCCHILCTQEELCGIFSVDHKTLTRWCKDKYNEDFSQVYKRLSQVGKMSVRRNLYRLSERNASACIFLAKNVLGYSDNGIQATPEETTVLLKSINEVLHEDIDELEP